MSWILLDIIKLSILSADLEDCYELGLFVRDYRKSNKKPLLAVGMGANGQLSRITSPVSLVTHPLIPFPSAPGQLSLAEVHRARHLMGQLPKQQVAVSGVGAQAQKVSQALNAAFAELGYPHDVTVTSAGGALDTIALGTNKAVTEAVASKFTEVTGRPAPLSVIQDAAAA